jgi:hypothetical protein
MIKKINIRSKYVQEAMLFLICKKLKITEEKILKLAVYNKETFKKRLQEV